MLRVIGNSILKQEINIVLVDLGLGSLVYLLSFWSPTLPTSPCW